ncbi:MAG: hypothetical protein HQ592_07225 [Planctomycetes bacterium]|nr:hypothetical protein [Planctomycetota bacterium]
MVEIGRACRFSLCIAAGLLVFCCAAQAQRRAPRYGLPRKFTIGLHAGATIDPADYALAAKAGFNLAVPLRPGLNYSRALADACGRAQMNAVVWDPRLATCDAGGAGLTAEVIREYGDRRAVAGYIVSNYQLVPPSRTTLLFWCVAELGMRAPRRFRYVEALHPKEFSGEKSCRQYIERHLDMGSGYVLYEEDDAFSSDSLAAMALVGKACAEHRKPWWRRLRIDGASGPMIRWQAYSAAAAGAHGIIYLIARPLPGHRADSLLDAEGKPAPIYETARATNKRLALLAPTLMAMQSATFYAVGNMPDGSPQPPDDSPIESITSGVKDDGFLVGLLQSFGRSYAFVVRKPRGADLPAPVTVRCAGGRIAVDVESGGTIDGPLDLLPGEGRLFLIK